LGSSLIPFADYLFYIDVKAAGVIEAKKVGTTLTGVEIQSDKYKHGFPDIFPAWYRPLPFCYQSTGLETRFTNGLDPEPCSRNVSSFHKPETLEAWLTDEETYKVYLLFLGFIDNKSPW
jgi:type I restriction enzyme R subunit